MNSEIEQRIVAMYFDNKDFEKNAQQTISTLGQLKEGLNLEESVKGFDELEKAGKKLNLNQAKTTVTNLKNALGGLGTAVQKAFNIGTAPLHALDNFFGTFRSYVGKFVGFDLASKFVNSLESAMRQLTIAPIEAGWQMYQANVDSVKTIMSGTMQTYSESMKKTSEDWTYDEAAHMEFVKGHLRELSDYAAKTVFSLQDMTSNIGKFTNQGVDLETSVMAMEGIANMTAKAGQSAQQASMAMYNFSQALGVGKMTTIDWKSIENANIATMELKDNFIRVAAAAGNLRKETDANGIEKFFYTLDKNGKELARNKWVEVSAENFRETLQHGWLDKDMMLRVMQLYSGQGFDLDTLATWGFDIKDTELMEELKRIGEEAMEAATQVRTFKKMWDALTESVQSSWADSMELIFGDMREATEFWTELNNKFSGVMDKIGKDRNDLLREWRGQTWDEESQAWVRLEGAVDGREDLIQGIYGIIDAANSLGSAFSNAWSDVFGNVTGETLQNITRGFREFVDSFKEWLGETNDADSRINKIRSGLSGVFSVLKIVWEVVKNMFGVIKEVIKPLIDPILNIFDKFGQWLKLDDVKNLGDILATLRDRFSQLWSRISGLGWSGVLGKIGEWMGNLWAQIRDGVSNFLQENGLGGVVDWFVQLGDNIKAGFDSVVEWWNSDENKISGFFKGIWESVTKWFKPSVDADGHEVRSPIVQFFYRIRDGVTEAFEAVKTWWKGSGIPEFFEGLWDAVSSIFKPKETTRYNGSMLETKVEDAPVVKFFKDTWETIKSVFSEVQGWTGWQAIGDFFGRIWEAISGIFTPKEITRYNGSMLETRIEEAPIVKFFRETWESIKQAVKDVKGWTGWKTIGNFFSGIWESISGIFKPKETTRYNGSMLETKVEDAPIVKFFKDTWETMKSAFEEVKAWKGWDAIGKFFSGVWESISGIFTPKEITRYNGSMLETRIEDAPIVKFFKDTWETIKSVFGEIAAWWNDPDNAVSGFFKNIWSSITGLFNGTGDVAEEVGDAAEKINDAAENATPSGASAEQTHKSLGIIGEFIDKVKSFITEVIDKVAGIEIPPQIETFFKGLGDFLLGVANIIGELIGRLGRTLAGEGSAGDVITVVLGTIAMIATQVFDFIHTKDLGKIETQSFGQKFMSFSIGLLAMASAIALLSTIEPEKMWPAVGVLAAMGIVIGAIVYFANNIQALASVETAQSTVSERLVGKLIDTIKIVGSIAVIMALLPPVIEAFGKAKEMAPELSGLDVIGIMTAVVVAVTGISAGLAIVDRITVGKGIDPLAAIKSAAALIGFIGVVALGLLGAGGLLELIDGIVDAIGGTDVDTVGALKGALEKVSALVEGIGGVLYGFVKGLFNIKTDKEKQDAAMENLNALAEVSDKFDLETTSGILRIMAMVTNLTKLTEKINIDKMDDFEKSMEQMARGILKFSWIFEGIDDIEGIGTMDSDRYKNFQGAIDLVQKTLNSFSGLKGFGDMGSQSTLMHGVKDFIEFANDDTSVQAFVDGVNKVLKSFAGLDDGSNVNFDGVKIIQTMYDAIQMAFTDPSANLPEFDATPIVDSIIRAIGLGESAIALAVHSMVQAGLNASENGGDTGGYTFDVTQALQFLQNPSDLSAITGNIDQYKEVLYGKGGTAENPAQDSLLGLFAGFSSEVEAIEIPSIADKFQNSISMKDPVTGEDINITEMMKGTIESLQTEIDNLPEFQIKIVPIFDYKNLNAESLRRELNDYPVRYPMAQSGYSIPETVQVDFTGINAALDLDGLKSRLDNINVSVDANGRAMVDAINSMGSHIDRISAAISQIKVYVDMYGMIPKIDKALGDRASKSAATGVSSMFNSPYLYLKDPVSTTE